MANERNFILQSFGLEYLKAAVYPAGKQLESGHTNMDSVAKKDIQNLGYNMTTNNMNTLSFGMSMTSMLGTPVFCDMILKDESSSKSIPLQWVLAEVNMQKNIVKTAVQGRNGTVKEYISDGDYQVTIRGGLFAPFSNAYPKDDVATLIELLQINNSIAVFSEYLMQFKIFKLVIEDYSLSQREGVQNVQLFEIKTVSDEPVNFKMMNS